MFFLRTLVIFIMTMWLAVATGAANPAVTILCYHDIGQAKNNPYMISKENLVEQFNYLKEHGYHPISVKQYIDANENGTALPEKPVLLSFDDGYISFYKVVYPLLKQYNYPGMLAIVTYWETAYHPAELGQIVNWNQIREMENSGIVTIASHSHNIHHLIRTNSYGDLSECGSSFTYLEGKHESLASYEKRINEDLSETQQIFMKELGHKVDALVWPYGEYTMMSVNIAKKDGFKVCFGLGKGYNAVGTPKSLSEAWRGLIYNKPSLNQFARFLNQGGIDDPPLKAAWVNIKDIYDPQSVRTTDENVRFLINRYARLGINTVFLPAYSDSKKDGAASGVYFYTTEAPVKELAYDHIARRFRAEGIYVYAWMPENEVANLVNGNPAKMTKLYSDLAQYSFLDGVILQNKESASLRQDAEQEKERMEILNTVHNFKPYAKFVTMLYPEEVSKQEQDNFFDKEYTNLLAKYDYILIRPNHMGEEPTLKSAEKLYPFMEKAMKQQGASAKIIAEVSAYDWKENKWFLDSELRDYIKTMKMQGIQQFDFYPDAVYSEKSGF